MNEEATAEIHYLWTTQLNFHIPEQKDWPDSPSLLQLPSNQPKKWQEQSEEVKRKEGKCHSLHSADLLLHILPSTGHFLRTFP